MENSAEVISGGSCSYGLILILYVLPYPKAVSDSMQKEIRHKQKKNREEMKARSKELYERTKKEEHNKQQV